MTNQQAAERMPATVREWTDILARIRFGKVKVAGRNITGATIKLVASRMASYADGNGTRVRPGVARIAVDLELDYRTARLAVTHLRTLGLLGLERAGGRRGADEYRLTLPVDLLDRDDLTVWSPSQHRLEIERLSDSHRRLPRDPRGGPGRGPGGGQSLSPEGPVNDDASLGHQGPVNETGSLGHQGPVMSDSGVPITGPSRPTYSPLTRPSGTRSLGPVGPATHQDLDTTTTHHPDQDLRTTVTLPDATSPATTPESPPRPKRCEHGLTGALRGDGRPACALCRVAETRIATVINIHTREAS